MQQEKIAILQSLQKSGGLMVVQYPADLGLTAKAFAVAVQSLCRNGLIQQEGLALAVVSGTPVTLRLASSRRLASKQVQPGSFNHAT
jgi:hypothetical protein